MNGLLIPVFVLFIIVVPLLALALLLCAVPVKITARIGLKEGRLQQALVISWGVFTLSNSGKDAGRVTEIFLMNHTVFSRSASGMIFGDIDIPDKPPISSGTTDDAEIIYCLLAHMEPAVSFGSAIWRECRFEEARGRVTLGLGDPVLTGECCGLYWASRFILEASRIFIELVPVFDNRILEFDISVTMRISHPILILISGLKLACHPAVPQAVKTTKQQSAGVPAS